LISRTRFLPSSFFCFLKIPALAATIRAQILRSALLLTTITTTIQPIVLLNNAILTLKITAFLFECSHVFARPISMFRVSKKGLAIDYRLPAHNSKQNPLSSVNPINPLCSEMAPRNEGQHDGYHSRPNKRNERVSNIDSSRASRGGIDRPL
jgi:hypothetical protein